MWRAPCEQQNNDRTGDFDAEAFLISQTISRRGAVCFFACWSAYPSVGGAFAQPCRNANASGFHAHPVAFTCQIPKTPLADALRFRSRGRKRAARIRVVRANEYNYIAHIVSMYLWFPGVKRFVLFTGDLRAWSDIHQSFADMPVRLAYGACPHCYLCIELHDLRPAGLCLSGRENVDLAR